MRHHAFVIETETEKGIEVASAWAKKELGMEAKGNPDVVILRYGIFSPDDARYVCDLAGQSAFGGEHRVLIIAATRAYHESQNALLKLFEEPPAGTYLFFILPSLGGLLPTLRSRVQLLDTHVGPTRSHIPEVAEAFLKATREKRSTIIKKLTSGKDEETRRENREEAIAILNGIEAIAYKKSELGGETSKLLSDISVLRGHLYDRSAPVRMILEHLSLVIPKEVK